MPWKDTCRHRNSLRDRRTLSVFGVCLWLTPWMQVPLSCQSLLPDSMARRLLRWNPNLQPRKNHRGFHWSSTPPLRQCDGCRRNQVYRKRRLHMNYICPDRKSVKPCRFCRYPALTGATGPTKAMSGFRGGRYLRCRWGQALLLHDTLLFQFRWSIGRSCVRRDTLCRQPDLYLYRSVRNCQHYID